MYDTCTLEEREEIARTIKIWRKVNEIKGNVCIELKVEGIPFKVPKVRVPRERVR